MRFFYSPVSTIYFSLLLTVGIFGMNQYVHAEIAGYSMSSTEWMYTHPQVGDCLYFKATLNGSNHLTVTPGQNMVIYTEVTPISYCYGAVDINVKAYIPPTNYAHTFFWDDRLYTKASGSVNFTAQTQPGNYTIAMRMYGGNYDLEQIPGAEIVLYYTVPAPVATITNAGSAACGGKTNLQVSGTNATNYKIFYQTPGTPGGAAPNIPVAGWTLLYNGSNTTYTHNAPAPNTQYTYALWATNAAGVTVYDTKTFTSSQACPFIELFRVNQGTVNAPNIVGIAGEQQGTVTSKLRTAKNGIVYGVVLVETTDPMASQLRIRLADGTIKALRKY